MESLLGKVTRHINQRDYDIQTVLRGTKEAFRRAQARGIDWDSIGNPEVTKNIHGLSGVDLYQYSLRSRFSKRPSCSPRIVSFPSGTALGVQVTEEPHVMRVIPEPYCASFSGPTFNEHSDFLPNNGFYHRGQYFAPFQDTDPTDLQPRRGAIAVTTSGTPCILTDEEKWRVLSDTNIEFQTIAGTGCFFSDEDDVVHPLFSTNSPISDISYFLTFSKIGKPDQFGFMASDFPYKRLHAKALFDNLAYYIGAHHYRVAELEYIGASCSVASRKTGETLPVIGFKDMFTRRDHYLVKLPKSKSIVSL